MAWIYCICGNKGGPGKTAETLGLAYALAKRGYKVAVAEMDAQGNLTRRCGIDKAALLAAGRPGIAEVLDPRRPAHIADAAVPCAWDDPIAANITVVPCLDRETMAERSEESGRPGAATRLSRALAADGWADDYHYVLIDTGPDVNHLLHNALVAADRAVLVLEPWHDSIEGAVYLADFIDRNRVAFDRPDLAVCGVAVNRYFTSAAAGGDADAAARSAKQRAHVANLPTTFARWGGAELIWQPAVPFMFTLSGAHDDAVPVSAIRHAVQHELSAIYDAHADRLIAVQEGAA